MRLTICPRAMLSCPYVRPYLVKNVRLGVRGVHMLIAASRRGLAANRPAGPIVCGKRAEGHPGPKIRASSLLSRGASPVAAWIVGPYGIFNLREYFGTGGVPDDESGSAARARAVQASQEAAAGAAIFSGWTTVAGGCGVGADD